MSPLSPFKVAQILVKNNMIRLVSFTVTLSLFLVNPVSSFVSPGSNSIRTKTPQKGIFTSSSSFRRPTVASTPSNDENKSSSSPSSASSSSSLNPDNEQNTAAAADNNTDEVVEVIVLGAGLGGLSCAALASKYGLHTLCLEAHDTPGGVAHSFRRYSSKISKTVPFCFDSGPSLISGLSRQSTNPLRQLLDAIGTRTTTTTETAETSHNTSDEGTIEWYTYDGWVVHDTSDQTSFRVTTGTGGDFERAIEQKAGLASRRAFEEFKHKLLCSKGLSEASTYVPPFALRGGFGVVASLSRYMLKLLSIGTKGTLLTGPFTKCMDLYEVCDGANVFQGSFACVCVFAVYRVDTLSRKEITVPFSSSQMNDPFVRKWFDYLAFALSGEDAAHTQAAPVAYMMRDLHSEGAVLDYPMGGMDSLIQAIVSGIHKHGGELRLNSRVESLLLEENSRGKATCTGVVLENGRRILATKAVVCNAPLWNMARILQDSISDRAAAPRSVTDAVSAVQKQANDMCMTGSFMHLHLGIPKAGLPEDLECHHSVLNMDMDVRAEQNMVIISIPTVFDPSLAPEGYHVVHAYTAASDSFDEWLPFIGTNASSDGQDSGKVGANPNSGAAASYGRSDEYQKLKELKAEALWKALERVIPDVRQRAQEEGSIVLIGTPLTHRRYNQRFRGTYGPGVSPGKDVWELGGALTPISNLLACGDTTFPGIGLPGVAASGTIAANTLVPVSQQMQLLQELQDVGSLQ